MEENKNYPDKQDSPSSRIAGLILIVLGLLIMILLFGDFVKALLISLSVFLLSYGFTLAIGKYRLAIFLVILYSLWKKDKENKPPNNPNQD